MKGSNSFNFNQHVMKNIKDGLVMLNIHDDLHAAVKKSILRREYLLMLNRWERKHKATDKRDTDRCMIFTVL